MSRDQAMLDRWRAASAAARLIVDRYRSEAPSGYDPQNSFAAVAIGVGAAGVVGGIASGVMQADAQKDASRQNRKAVEDTNQLNYEMFRESRGEGGSALLPLYAKEGAEESMLNDAMGIYNALIGRTHSLSGKYLSPSDKLKEYAGQIDVMRPAIEGGNRVISDIYSGAMAEQRLADLAPVLQARAELAQSQADAVNLALAEEQARINAEEAEKGFVGGGTFTNNRLLQAAIQARQQAAQAKGVANLENAQDKRGVAESTRDLQVRSLDIPLNRANQIVAFNQAPANALLAEQAAAQAALDWFKMAPGSPPRAQAPQVSAVPSTGAVIASGVAQGAGALGDYLMTRNYLDALKKSQAATTNPVVVQPAMSGVGGFGGGFGA